MKISDEMIDMTSDLHRIKLLPRNNTGWPLLTINISELLYFAEAESGMLNGGILIISVTNFEPVSFCF